MSRARVTPVFVIAAARSGTTWLTQALNAHPDVLATELRAFGQHFDVVQDAGAPTPRLRCTLDRYVDALLTSHVWPVLGQPWEATKTELLDGIYQAIFAHALDRSGKSICIDKVTPYNGTAGAVVAGIRRHFPSAKMIYLARDGRDVAVSGVFHWFSKNMADETPSTAQAQRHAAFAQGTERSLDRFFTTPELTEWADHWRDVAEAVAADAGTAGGLQLRVSYEALSADFCTELQRILEFVGVPDASLSAAEACRGNSTFELMSGGRNRGDAVPGAHVRKGVVGDWRQYFTRDDAVIFDEIAGAQLIGGGYERDRGWVDATPARLAA